MSSLEVIHIGSIFYINTNPKTWISYNIGKKLKSNYGGEELYKIYYGTFDDYPNNCSSIEMLMRSSIYNGLISGNYKVSPQSNRQGRLIVQDAHGNELYPLKDGFCY